MALHDERFFKVQHSDVFYIYWRVYVLQKKSSTKRHFGMENSFQIVRSNGRRSESIGEHAIANTFGTGTLIPRKHTGSPCGSFLR